MFDTEKAKSSGYFVTVNATDAGNGITAVLDDTIMVKGQKVTAGSKMLYNFVSPFGATVVDKLDSAGVKVIGKAAMREFGIGKVECCTTDALGGLSAVENELCDVALINDFSGENRRTAAEKNLIYIHPTYGTVSRLGLIPAVSSVDRIGVAAKDIDKAFSVLASIAGHDASDGTSYPQESYSYAPNKSLSEIKIGVAEIGDNTAPLKSTAEKLSALDAKAESVSLPFAVAVSAALYILSCAEISNNITRYDGVKFGYRADGYKGINDLYLLTRTQAFSADTKLTAIMGAMVLSQEYYDKYYNKSMQVRRLIKNELESLFGKYDAIVLPASLGDGKTPYDNTVLTGYADLAGLPSLSVDGIQIIANTKNENVLYSIGKALKGERA